MLASWLGQPVY